MNPPAKPVDSRSLTTGSTAPGFPIAIVTNHASHALPTTLTNNVPHGNDAPNHTAKKCPTKNRAMLPIHPPTATARICVKVGQLERKVCMFILGSGTAEERGTRNYMVILAGTKQFGIDLPLTRQLIQASDFKKL